MPPVPIPYARQQAYDNAAYVRMMSELMLQNAERQQQLRLARGANSQQMWTGLGQTAMATMAQIGNQRDEQQKLAMLQAERDRDYEMKKQEMAAATEERKLAREYQQRTEARAARLDKAATAKEFTENTQIGTVVPNPVYNANVSDTGSAGAYRPQAYEAARLPATPMADMGGYASSPTEPTRAGGIPQFAPTAPSNDPEWFNHLSSAPPTSTSPMAPAEGGQSEYLLAGRGPTMSQDTAERQEGMRRVASQPELMQLETLRRQAEAAWQLAQDRKEDNAARDQAARALAAYQAESLRLRGRQIAATEANAGGQPQIVEAGGQFYRVGKGPGGVVEQVMTPDGAKPLTKFSDTSGLGDYQNVAAFALGKMPENKKGAAVATIDRLIREDNKPELLAFLKKTVTDNISGTERALVLGRDGAIASLTDARAALQQLKAKGVNTGLIPGKAEDIRRYFGKTGNPELVELGTMLANSLGNYRRAMTGLAFSDTESKDYAKQWPSYMDEAPVNEAKINGLLNAMSSYDRSFWLSQLGPSAAKIFGTGSATTQTPTGKPKAQFSPDGKTLILPR